MKFFVVFSSLLSLICGDLSRNYLPPLGGGSSSSASSSGRNAGPASEYANDNNGDGNYRYSYQSPTGINAQESGRYVDNLPEGGAIVAQGSYSFTAPDGNTYEVRYTADENGFHPVGAHLPTSPPIPDAIAKSLGNGDNSGSGNDDNSGSGNNDGGYRY